MSKTVTINNAVAYVGAQLSRATGAPPGYVVSARRHSCFGPTGKEWCPHVQVNQDPPYNKYCGGCGCGKGSNLERNIVTFAYLRCVLGRPGFGIEWFNKKGGSEND